MLLKNVQIINHDSIIPNAILEIENSIIKSILPISGKPDFIVIPGFIDVHIHGFNGNDVMDSIKAIEEMSKDLKKIGTTSFLPTLMTESMKKMFKVLKDILNAKTIGSKIIGSHMEGPFLSYEKKGTHNDDFLLRPEINLIQEFIDQSEKTLKKITLAPELFSDNQLKFISNNNIIISIGHSNGTAFDVEKAIKNGANSCTHLWNAMTGVMNRNPGIVEGVLLSDQMYAEIICDLIHVDKKTIQLTTKTKGISKVIAVTDGIKSAGMPDGDSILDGLPVTKKGNVIFVRGTNKVVGSTVTMYDNFKNLINIGYDIKDVVAMTSYNASKQHNLNLGEIKINKKADLIVMNNKYEIIKVLVDGR